MLFEAIIFFLMIVPGLLFAVQGSSYLVDYTILVFVFNREIRRLVDYSNHQFNAFSLISLTPLVMLGLLFVAFVWNFTRLHRNAQQIFVLMLAAIGYGMIIGLW